MTRGLLGRSLRWLPRWLARRLARRLCRGLARGRCIKMMHEKIVRSVKRRNKEGVTRITRHELKYHAPVGLLVGCSVGCCVGWPVGCVGDWNDTREEEGKKRVRVVV